jgi:hypothetical protein
MLVIIFIVAILSLGKPKGYSSSIKPSIQDGTVRDKWKIDTPPIEIETKMQVQDILGGIWCFL